MSGCTLASNVWELSNSSPTVARSRPMSCIGTSPRCVCVCVKRSCFFAVSLTSEMAVDMSIWSRLIGSVLVAVADAHAERLLFGYGQQINRFVSTCSVVLLPCACAHVAFLRASKRHVGDGHARP